MSDRRNKLLLATLQRAGKPLDSAELLAQATELAMDYLWTPAGLGGLTRKGVAKRCADMEAEGLLKQEGVAMDGRSRRTTPLYMPVAGYDKEAKVPKPPAVQAPTREEPADPFNGMSRVQLMAVLESHDEIAECVGRFLNDMRTARDKARQRLQAVGLETH
jgi:hypothetical protein